MRRAEALAGAAELAVQRFRERGVVMGPHTTMDALLAGHRLLEEIDAVQEAWNDVATAVAWRSRTAGPTPPASRKRRSGSPTLGGARGLRSELRSSRSRRETPDG